MSKKPIKIEINNIPKPFSDEELAKFKKDWDIDDEAIFADQQKKPLSEGVTYDFSFSSNLPKLETGTGKFRNVIDVGVSSTEEDNQKLLHYLHKNIR